MTNNPIPKAVEPFEQWVRAEIIEEIDRMMSMMVQSGLSALHHKRYALVFEALIGTLFRVDRFVVVFRLVKLS